MKMTRILHEAVTDKTNQIILQARHKHSGNKPGFPRKTLRRTMSQFESHLSELGIDTRKISDRAKSLSRAKSQKRDMSRGRTGRKRERSVAFAGEEETDSKRTRSTKRRKPSLGRDTGFKNVQQKMKGVKLDS
eukprot:TRINITY_DN7374_c0_g1_i1.p1 TRINITY_DN7374_c0_g1~~TRINITY_DN7374_c0_g1_i1.p1  ORF type:complete len:133 (+),score=21.24 TRINITY_DN7374_c0_g1_i1:217-615(+)